MQEELLAQIRTAVVAWARETYDDDEVIVGMVSEDDLEDEDGTRYVVDYAVRREGQWLVAEVWAADGAILNINDLGEGLPLDNAAWPWPAVENG
jgi:hypothetical protein